MLFRDSIPSFSHSLVKMQQYSIIFIIYFACTHPSEMQKKHSKHETIGNEIRTKVFELTRSCFKGTLCVYLLSYVVVSQVFYSFFFFFFQTKSIKNKKNVLLKSHNHISCHTRLIQKHTHMTSSSSWLSTESWSNKEKAIGLIKNFIICFYTYVRVIVHLSN